MSKDISNNTLYFCNGKNPILFSDNYIKVTDINAEDLFPKIHEGNDFILLVLDEYSVTQYMPNFFSNNIKTII